MLKMLALPQPPLVSLAKTSSANEISKASPATLTTAQLDCVAHAPEKEALRDDIVNGSFTDSFTDSSTTIVTARCC